MIPSETMQKYNIELDCNLEAMPSHIAFLIYQLQTFQNYKPSKRRAILAAAIETLYKGV